MEPTKKKLSKPKKTKVQPPKLDHHLIDWEVFPYDFASTLVSLLKEKARKNRREDER